MRPAARRSPWCNLTERESIRQAVDAAIARYGRIDRVFSNAGFYDNEHDSIEVDDDVWQMNGCCCPPAWAHGGEHRLTD